METNDDVSLHAIATAVPTGPDDAGARLAAARASVRRVRLVAAHPAINFVNTASGPSHADPDDDVLVTYTDLLAWAEYAGILHMPEVEVLSALAVEHERSSEAVLARAVQLRNALHVLFEAIAHGDPDPGAAVEFVESIERDAIAHGVLARRGPTFEWSWPDPQDLARPVWIVVHAAVELLRTGPLDRLKECGACRFVFLDESKNRSRRWCAMSDCGAASKARAYVTRRAARRAERRAAPAARASVPGAGQPRVSRR